MRSSTMAIPADEPASRPIHDLFDSHQKDSMLIRIRYGLLAIILVLSPQLSSAQASGFGAYFRGDRSWSSYDSYGGGTGVEASFTVGGALSSSYARQASYTFQSGQGATQAAFGFLTASANAVARTGRAPGDDLWFNAAASMGSRVYWYDDLAIQSAGQLIFNLALSDARQLTPGSPANTRVCDVYGFVLSAGAFGPGTCALAAAQWEIGGANMNIVRLERTTTPGGAKHPGDARPANGQRAGGRRVARVRLASRGSEHLRKHL